MAKTMQKSIPQSREPEIWIEAKTEEVLKAFKEIYQQDQKILEALAK